MRSQAGSALGQASGSSRRAVSSRKGRQDARNHSFRAAEITAYLKNGGTLEKPAAMGNHATARTTQAYHRRRAELTRDERIGIFNTLEGGHATNCNFRGVSIRPTRNRDDAKSLERTYVR
jgi:hypothetical protein